MIVEDVKACVEMEDVSKMKIVAPAGLTADSVRDVEMMYVMIMKQETAALWIAGMSLQSVEMENVDIWSHVTVVPRIVGNVRVIVEMECVMEMKHV